MRAFLFMAAAALLSSVADAAPRALELDQVSNLVDTEQEDVEKSQLLSGLQAIRHRFVRHVTNMTRIANGTNATTTSTSTMATLPMGNVVQFPGLDMMHHIVTVECPAPPLVISTTTIDVTVYVTPTEEPCDETTTTSLGTAPYTSLAPVTSIESEPCDTETLSRTATFALLNTTRINPMAETRRTEVVLQTASKSLPVPSYQNVTESCDEESSTSGIYTTTKFLQPTAAMGNGSGEQPQKSIQSTTTPCSTDPGQRGTITSGISSQPSPSIKSLGPFVNTTSSHGRVSSNSTSTTSKPTTQLLESTEPCESEATASSLLTQVTEPITQYNASRTFSVTPFKTTTSSGSKSTRTATTTTCVIDKSMTPATTAKMTSTPVIPTKPTMTMCQNDAPTGTPSKGSVYCGVKAKPAESFFLAEFIEDRPGVPISEEGCFQFCDSDMDSTHGCQSYRFYSHASGAPRCALYGMPVSWVVEEITVSFSDQWYDLTCGSPTEARWPASMPASHEVGASDGGTDTPIKIAVGV